MKGAVKGFEYEIDMNHMLYPLQLNPIKLKLILYSCDSTAHQHHQNTKWDNIFLDVGVHPSTGVQ